MPSDEMVAMRGEGVWGGGGGGEKMSWKKDENDGRKFAKTSPITWIIGSNNEFFHHLNSFYVLLPWKRWEHPILESFPKYAITEVPFFLNSYSQSSPIPIS